MATELIRGNRILWDVPDRQLYKIKKSLEFANPAYVKAVENGLPTDALSPIIYGWRTHSDGCGIEVPRYYKHGLPISEFEQDPVVGGEFVHELRSAPRPNQLRVANFLDGQSGDVGLCLPCGYGKSFLSLYYASKFKGRVLIVCPTEVKLQEWQDQVELHLGLPRSKIGRVQASTRSWEEFPVTVTMLKTLATQSFDPDFVNGFSCVIWDEAHLCGAPMMSRALGKVNGRQVTLTATPGSGVRRKLIELNVGSNWISEEMQGRKVSVYFVSVPVSEYIKKLDWRFQKIRLAKNSDYTNKAAGFVQKSLAAGRRTLVLNSQVDPLVYLKRRFRSAGFVVGSQSLKDIMKEEVRERYPARSWKSSANQYFADVKKTYNPILATGLTKTQPGGMGMDVSDLDGGVVMFPVADPDMTQQMLGRWQREHPTKKDPILGVMFPKTNQGTGVANKMARTLSRLGADVHMRL